MTPSLSDNFDQYFRILVATTPELAHCAYRIRHQVYCDELGWEPCRNDRLETDSCDPYAISLLLQHKRSQRYAGTARLVIPPPFAPHLPLPFEMHCLDSIYPDTRHFIQQRRGAFGEISRLAVPLEFRRRTGEANKPFIIDKAFDNHGGSFCDAERRHFPNIAIGLYLSAIALVSLCQHSHMFVVVEPRLRRRLGRLGLNFNQWGHTFEFHGTRALYALESEAFSQHLSTEIAALYDLLTTQVKRQLLLYPYALGRQKDA